MLTAQCNCEYNTIMTMQHTINTNTPLSFCGTDVGLNWAVAQAPGLVTHNSQGGIVLNLVDGTAVTATTSKTRAAIAHGAMMIVAFAILMPLGALLARHKWLFGRKEVGGCRAAP